MTDYIPIKRSDIDSLKRYFLKEEKGVYINVDDLLAILDKAPSFEATMHILDSNVVKIAELEARIADLEAASAQHYEAKLAKMQAKIDALMLEYCPDEMTKEQVSNWMESQSEFLENTEFLAKDK